MINKPKFTINRLFEEQVEKTPDNIAIVFDKKLIRYSELNQMANSMANYILSKCKVNKEDLIALCMDRNEDMLIAILVVLKLGCAYVPIDPSYPLHRINYILNDTKAKIASCNT